MSEPAERTIGPYRLIRGLGAGGMGEVFLAHDPRLRRQVAIKRIRADFGESSVRRVRFLREARLAASLNHPAIVQVFDLMSDEGTDSIVMEYVPGTSLHQALKQGPLPLARGLAIAVAAAEGLAYAHRQGILHRDLKTENVLLTTDGQAKIADFGIARRLETETEEGTRDETLTQEGIAVGTPRAMSPEQACGDGVDARSDLFSLGVLLYELFTGQSPFLAPTAAETLQRVLAHRPPPAHALTPGLPPALSGLLAQLLEKQPERRPQTAAEVAASLRSLAFGTAGSGEMTVGPPTRTEEAEPRLRSRRLGRGFAVAVAVVALTALLAFLVSPFVSPAPKPLFVAVMQPRLQTGPATEETAFLAFALRGAVERALVSFVEVFPKSGAEVDAAAGTPVQVARAVAAEEVIESGFGCRDRACTLELKRLRGTDGAATWSGRIDVPLDDPLTAARAVAVLLRQAYGDKTLRGGVPEIHASPADYAAYVQVRRALMERNGETAAALLEKLAALRRRSPEFVEPYLLAATLEVQSFLSADRDPARLGSALALLAQARALAPGDPEVYVSQAYSLIQGGRLREAETTLERLAAQAPGDVRVLDLRALLAERQGRSAEAIALYRQAVDRRPSAARLYQFAALAWRQGEVKTARETLARLLALSPGDGPGRHLLAAIELMHGDPGRAATLYEELAAHQPAAGDLVNLGIARMLLGTADGIAGAAEAFERALVKSPDDYFTLLNLAQARWLQGRRPEAAALFRRVIELSARDPSGEEWQRLTVRGQALAFLGQGSEAEIAVQEATRIAPRNGQAAFEAALVYALAGDRTMAVVTAKRARDLGFDSPAWFRLPWFQPLFSDSEFRKLAQISPPR